MRSILTRPSQAAAPVLGLAIALGIVSAPGLAQRVPPTRVTLQDLTVPADRLPDGCRLKVILPPRQEILAPTESSRTRMRLVSGTPSMQPEGITANPWVGTDRRILATLRPRVEGLGPMRAPDAPPLTARETSAMSLQLADGVEEGYAATYIQEHGRDLGVWAVRFTVPPAKSEFVNGADTARDVRTIDVGSIRAILFADDGACSTAIEAHLRSLHQRP